LVDRSVLNAREDLLGTTSSSSLVYATLDGWRRQMVQQGEQLLTTAIERARRVRDAIGQMEGLQLMGREVVRPQGAFDLDPLVLTVDVRQLGVSGYQAGAGRAGGRPDRGRGHQPLPARRTGDHPR
jgi:arginine decarboxylase